MQLFTEGMSDMIVSPSSLAPKEFAWEETEFETSPLDTCLSPGPAEEVETEATDAGENFLLAHGGSR